MASAKLANRTVNHSQRAICTEKPTPSALRKMSRTTKTVVTAAPTSTTNITGFLITTGGLSLTNDSRIARLTISGSNKGRARTSFFGSSVVSSSRTGLGGVRVVAMDQLQTGNKSMENSL